MQSKDDIRVGDLVTFIDYYWDATKREEISERCYSIVLGIRKTYLHADDPGYNLYRLKLPNYSSHGYTEVTIDDDSQDRRPGKT
jgi:hypothetical protein